jgi:hypothetical protein
MAENPTLNFDTFATRLDTPFWVRRGRANPDEDLAVELRLIEAADKSNHRQEMFSIVFQGPDQTFLPQGLYSMEHDKVGAFELFIVPIGHDQNGYHYEAVFNRLRERQ